jgi:hypothetical protein
VDVIIGQHHRSASLMLSRNRRYIEARGIALQLDGDVRRSETPCMRGVFLPSGITAAAMSVVR